jgi:hypothetical protein
MLAIFTSNVAREPKRVTHPYTRQYSIKEVLRKLYMVLSELCYSRCDSNFYGCHRYKIVTDGIISQKFLIVNPLTGKRCCSIDNVL